MTAPTPDAGAPEVRVRKDVSLEPLGEKHAEAMYRWVRDPEVAGNIGLSREPSPERTREWIGNAARDEDVAAFAVVAGGRHVGNVVLDRIDRRLSTARLSVYVGEPDARGKGAGTAAVWLALRHGFRSLNLHKIWLTVHARNERALSTYADFGFSREGRLREEFLLGGERVDLCYLGLLRPEFDRIRVTD